MLVAKAVKTMQERINKIDKMMIGATEIPDDDNEMMGLAHYCLSSIVADDLIFESCKNLELFLNRKISLKTSNIATELVIIALDKKTKELKKEIGYE